MDVKKVVERIKVDIAGMVLKLDRLQLTLDSVVDGSGGPVLDLWDEKPGFKISRVDARLWGIARYNSGVPCSNGHRAWRYVSNGCCVDCLAVRAAMLKRAKSHGDVVRGDVCEKGHIGWRYSATGECVECDKGRTSDGRLVMGGVPGVSGRAAAQPKPAGKLVFGGVPKRSGGGAL